MQKVFYETDFFIGGRDRLGRFHIGSASAVERYGYCFAEYGGIGSDNRCASAILVPDGNRGMEYYRFPVFDGITTLSDIRRFLKLPR